MGGLGLAFAPGVPARLRSERTHAAVGRRPRPQPRTPVVQGNSAAAAAPPATQAAPAPRARLLILPGTGRGYWGAHQRERPGCHLRRPPWPPDECNALRRCLRLVSRRARLCRGGGWHHERQCREPELSERPYATTTGGRSCTTTLYRPQGERAAGLKSEPEDCVQLHHQVAPGQTTREERTTRAVGARGRSRIASWTWLPVRPRARWQRTLTLGRCGDPRRSCASPWASVPLPACP